MKSEPEMKKKFCGKINFCLYLGSRQGSALIIAIIISVVIAMLALVGTQLMLTDFQNVKQQQYLVSSADSVARSGISDATAWFRRQANQPVKSGVPPVNYSWVDGAFDPKISTDPTHSDTMDAGIGIVQEYQLSDTTSLWARYEVKRQTNPAIVPYDQYAVHDVTGERLNTGQKDGDGYVWYLPSRGYIYRKINPAVSFKTAPNQIVARSLVSTEIRRITLNLQLPVACIVNNGGSTGNETVKIFSKGRVYGGTYGCGRSSGASPWLDNGTMVTGTSAGWNPKSFMLDQHNVQYVLGVSTTELRILADYYVPSVAQLPAALPDMSLIYINGNAVFNSSRPLVGSGILFVQGNLTISNGSNSFFSGLIYVTGTATIQDPCLISGCVVAYQGLTLSRSDSTDTAEIKYDQNILNMVRQQVCQYREMKSTYRVYTGIPNF